MKNSKGLGVIRLGDSTSHGGKVISAATDFKALGKAIALHGDQATCPQCKGPLQYKCRRAITNTMGRPLRITGIEPPAAQG